MEIKFPSKDPSNDWRTLNLAQLKIAAPDEDSYGYVDEDEDVDKSSFDDGHK
jgi:hypothetical protein